MAGDAGRQGWRLTEIVARLGGRISGDGAVCVDHVATLSEAGEGGISFLANPKYRAGLARTRASAVIVAADAEAELPCAGIVADNPYLYFAQVTRLLNPEAPQAPGVAPAAVVIGEVHPEAWIGPGAVVDAGAYVAAGARVGPGAWIGAHARVGEGSVLWANVAVYPRCVIGQRCIVHAGVVIGADGFGFAHDNGRWVKIPQVGRVVIGDDVEIGANTTIDRGAIGDTVIENGVKLDNQIQVAHNVRIGEHTAVAGCVGIAGSTRIGRHCAIGGAAGIIGHLTITDHVTVSAGTLVTSSITEPGTYTGVFPLQRHADWLKTGANLRQIDRLARQVKVLEKRLAELEKTSST